MILVSGGTGLVGAHLLLSLCKQGHSPRALYRSESSKQRVLSLFKTASKKGQSLYDQIHWAAADLLHIPDLETAFEGVTELYHCAALISFNPKDYQKLKQTNVHGTANMVNLSLDFGVKKMCYVSSIASLGKAPQGSYITEQSSWNQEKPNVYAMSKYEAELEVWRGIQEGLKAVILNPGVILGSGFWKNGSGKLFHFAAKGLPFYFPGGTGFVGVEDVVNCMQTAMNSSISEERYICVSENLSYRELFEKMAKGFGKKTPTYEIPQLALEILWRLDYVKQLFFGGSRRISKQSVQGLKSRDTYSAQKSITDLGMQYTTIDQVIEACCLAYGKQHKKG